MTTTETRDQAVDQSVDMPRAASDCCGLPPEQVHAWLQHVQSDMREVRTRIEFLRAEQSRLESQRRLLAELLTSSNPI
jgi:predicted nuclease with TOPRIM domain